MCVCVFVCAVIYQASSYKSYARIHTLPTRRSPNGEAPLKPFPDTLALPVPTLQTRLRSLACHCFYTYISSDTYIHIYT